MSRKSVLFFLFIAALVGGTWYCLAEKFEHVAQNEIMPKLEKYQHLVNTADADVKINKYMFNVELGSTSLLEANEDFSLNIDTAKIYYNPFTDKLVASVGGGKISLEAGGTKYIGSNPNVLLEFDRGLINHNFENYNVYFSSSDMEFVDEKTSKPILTYEKFGLNFSYDKSGELTLMDGELDFKQAMISADLHNAFMELGNSAFMGSPDASGIEQEIQQQIRGIFSSDEAKEYMNKFNESIGKIDYNLAFDTKLPKVLTDAFVSTLANEEVSPLVLLEMAEKDMNLMLTETFSASEFKSSSKVQVAKEASEVFAGIIVDLDMSLSKETKDSLFGVYSVVTRDVFSLLTRDKGYNTDEFKPIIAQLLGFQKYKFDMSIAGNIETGLFKMDMISDTDGKKFKIDAESKGMMVEAGISIDNFGNLVNKSISWVKSIAEIVVSKREDLEDVRELQESLKVLNYSQGNLFKALKALHKGSDLARDGTLKTDIHLNGANFDLKVNDKPVFELMSDPRVVEFMKNMPQIDQ